MLQLNICYGAMNSYCPLSPSPFVFTIAFIRLNHWSTCDTDQCKKVWKSRPICSFVLDVNIVGTVKYTFLRLTGYVTGMTVIAIVGDEFQHNLSLSLLNDHPITGTTWGVNAKGFYRLFDLLALRTLWHSPFGYKSPRLRPHRILMVM